MVKLSTLFFYRDKVQNILSVLVTRVLNSNAQYEANIELTWTKKSIVIAEIQTFVGITTGFVIITICALISYLSERKLPFGSIIISRYFSYELVLIYQFVIFGFIVLTSVVSDVFFASILAQLCVQCKILQNSIQKIIENSIQSARQDKHVINTVSDIPWKYLHKALEEIIIHHRSIIELAQEVEDMCNIPALAVFIGMSIGFCFIVYQLSMQSGLNWYFFKSILMLLGAITSLFLNGYYGSVLTYESLTIADTCYEVDFIGTDIRFQKALRFLMQRSQKPIKITIGKFDTLSLVMIVGIVRFAYSSITLLHKVNEDWDKHKWK